MTGAALFLAFFMIVWRHSTSILVRGVLYAVKLLPDLHVLRSLESNKVYFGNCSVCIYVCACGWGGDSFDYPIQKKKKDRTTKLWCRAGTLLITCRQANGV